ncbi:TadE/TadG family type IV pilus assembly protein [Paucisalibacillus globulus]|uniref:TadE/TadG family type IV pilus assembly protein n=1 Tax=Paucisalibacillus globulus TaxID=351095 RepID=UPI00040D2C84|nr:TadE family protein [Paucisalibacillus globulus]
MFLKKEDGSITIEATLIIPIFLFFILFLTSLSKITIAEMALEESMSETAQGVAHYSYLAMVGQKQIQTASEGFVDSLTETASGKLGNHAVANYLLDKLATIGKDMIPSSGQALNYFSDSIYEGMIIDSYKEKVNSSDFFNPNGITVTNSTFPQSTSGEGADVLIEAENELKLVLPFFEKTIKIKKVVVERAWVGTE